MSERPVVSSYYSLSLQRLPDCAIDVAKNRVFDAAEYDTFVLKTEISGSDVSICIECSIGQLEHLQASIDALLQDRSRALGPSAAIESAPQEEEF